MGCSNELDGGKRGGGEGGDELELRHGELDGQLDDISWLVVWTTLVDFYFSRDV